MPEEHTQEFNPLSARDSRNLSELHDAYRTFCEYGWHHLTWKNLAYTLATYLSTYFRQDHNGHLLHSRIDAARSEYLAHLNVEAFGYLTKDALWCLLRRTGFSSDYELNLGYHRPFQTPAWQYLMSLAYNDLRILIVDVANVLRDRTTSSHARGNILSLAPDWRPTFGAEYGIFQFLEVELSPDDSTSLNQLQLERNVASRPLAHFRPKGFLKRALSVKTLQSRSRAQSIESAGEDSQNRKRFSWPLTERYRRLFPRKRDTESTIKPGDTTIRPEYFQTPAPTAKAASRIEDTSSSPNGSSTSFTGGHQVLCSTLEEEDSSDAESVKSSNTLDSLLDFYTEGLQYPIAVEISRPAATLSEVPRPDSPILMDKPPASINRNSSLRSTGTGQRSISPSSGRLSFVTAKGDTFSRSASRADSRVTRRSSQDSFLSFNSTISGTAGLPKSSDYYRLLDEQNLIPEPAVETDWSGRGQHAEFTSAERDLIPLQAEELLGRTRTAIVESVRCKRVRLARKTIKCSRWTGVKREDALREVQHLYRAQHAHIVRLVGTYVIGSDLAILSYPCAEWNLEQFMTFSRTAHESSSRCAAALRQFFTCIVKVLDFLHSLFIKHMDIKPPNLLVRDMSTSIVSDSHQYKLYFTDFGISRAYETVDDCDTESPTSFTRAYAAREVVIQESRGLSADMFSLGCVYSEMLATILDASIAASGPQGKVLESYWATLRAARGTFDDSLRPYHSATEEVRAWLRTLPIQQEPELLVVRDWTIALMSNKAMSRPTARQIADDPRLPFACLSCNLRRGPEDFEAAPPLDLTPRQANMPQWDGPPRTAMEVPAVA